ncbi:hypothetical protein [Actinoplanes awajinensis]|uniref:hypothetical protein n=1 Tax=Actinoplanes awajinensis TaxID=135946 RepID=UPI0009FFD878|nr:hypothetical protein [Actinoplanes awajinensis]
MNSDVNARRGLDRFFPTLSMMLDILPETSGPLILDVRQNEAGPAAASWAGAPEASSTPSKHLQEVFVCLFGRIPAADLVRPIRKEVCARCIISVPVR